MKWLIPRWSVRVTVNSLLDGSYAAILVNCADMTGTFALVTSVHASTYNG